MKNDKIISMLAPSFLPATCVLELTYKCNHKCLFCSCPWEADNDYKKRQELSLDEWKRCIKTLTENGVFNIALSGGEPLLNKNIKEIIKFASSCMSDCIETIGDSLVSERKPPKMYLISNGALINDEILKLCREHKVHLSMSLPGLRTFKDHTGFNNSSKVLKNFKKANKLGIDTTVNIAVTKKNLPELYETISEALLAGADSLLINRFMPGGRGLKSTDLMLSREELNEMLDIAEEVLSTAKRYGSVGTELPKCVINNPNKYKYLKVSTQCSAAIDFFVISPSGFIRTCNHSSIELDYFSDFMNLCQNSYWQKFAQKCYHPASCNECNLISKCDGGCREAAHALYGNIDSIDPVFQLETPV